MQSVYLLAFCFIAASSAIAKDGREVEFNGLIITIPDTFEKELEHREGKHTVIVWKIRDSESKTPPVFSLSSNPEWNSTDQGKVSAHVAGFINSVKKQRTNWSQTPTKRGSRNGITFWKTSWTGQNKQSGELLKGIVVAALIDERLTYIAAQASEEDADLFLKQILEMALGSRSAESE